MESRSIIGSALYVADQVLRHSSVSWRHWRTMALFSARSQVLFKLDAVLVSASEFARILAAAYLSPSFLLFLCLEIWQYLRSLAAANGFRSAFDSAFKDRTRRGLVLVLSPRVSRVAAFALALI